MGRYLDIVKNFKPLTAKPIQAAEPTKELPTDGQNVFDGCDGFDVGDLTMPNLSTSYLEHVKDWPEDLRMAFEERAAILHNDGGLSQEEAEREAFDETLELFLKRNSE